MSAHWDSYPRIAPDHVLNRAARMTNDVATLIGAEGTFGEIGLDVGMGELAYFCQQRALRAAGAAFYDVALGAPGREREDEELCKRIVVDPRWASARVMLIASCMDGITIGYQARTIVLEEKGA